MKIYSLVKYVAATSCFLLLHQFARADINSAVDAFKNVQCDKAYALLKPLAEAGDPLAQTYLGSMYMWNTVPSINKDPQSSARGRIWYQRAADSGFALAQYALAEHYSNSSGVSPSERLSLRSVTFELYKKAAAQKYPAAYGRLGGLYEFGFGVEKNASEAIKLYIEGANLGDADAQFVLGARYLMGKNIEEDEEKGIFWLSKAANQKQLLSAGLLATAYTYRKSGEKHNNELEAAYWLKKQDELLNQPERKTCGRFSVWEN